MLDGERKYLDTLSAEVALWEGGGLEGAVEQQRLVSAIVKYVEDKRSWLETLRARPRTDAVDAAVSEAVSEFNAAAVLKNRVVDITERATERRNQELAGWNGRSVVSDGWYVPSTTLPGVQSVRTTCCQCGHKLIFDFKVCPDQRVAYRTYLDTTEKHDAQTEEDGAGGERPECAAAG
jgi:hypothetical protein